MYDWFSISNIDIIARSSQDTRYRRDSTIKQTKKSQRSNATSVEKDIQVTEEKSSTATSSEVTTMNHIITFSLFAKL